jgi:aspartyl-tRNA(Asn)/glutamyl-tRNA(Gln) amidotransferase subunit A
MDKLGPLCRTAHDCGLVLAALAGPDPLDPSASARRFTWPDAGKDKSRKFRVGVIKGCTAKVQPAVKKNFDKSLEVLRKIADVEEDVAFPDLPFSEVVHTIIEAEAASAFRDLLDSGQAGQLRSANDRWGGYAASMVLAVDYLQAMRARGPMKRALDRLYAKYDALVAPARGSVAYPIGKDFEKVYPGVSSGPPVIPAGNAVGQPALSVPNGFGLKGLPTGIQFTGRVWGEARLLALARAYQEATDWHKRRPPLK